jgi:signal transduction histidine kinase
MKERARHLNAAFQVDSTLGDGTRVTVEVPLGVTPPAEY